MAVLADPLCDICGAPQAGRALYGLGTRRDDEGDIVSIRHWDCEQRDGVFPQLAQLRQIVSELDHG